MTESVAIGANSIGAGLSSITNESARLRQALVDLKESNGSEVSLIHCESPDVEAAAVEAFGRAASSLQFVTATLSLRRTGLEALDDATRELCDALVRPGRRRPTAPDGLFGLLDWFIGKHGAEAAQRFTEASERHDARGDLSELCAGYIGSEGKSRSAQRVLLAWLRGTELKGRARLETVHSALSQRTAKQVLGELTRLVRALGFPGSLIIFTEAEALVHRTQRQRQRAYTVLRELVDNFDRGQGMAATKLIVCGRDALFSGRRSIETLPPLLDRVRLPSVVSPAPPHRSLAILESGDLPARNLIRPVEPKARQHRALRTMIRIAQGLPPTEAVATMSVGYDKLDHTISQLLEHASIAGSVFSVLEGNYGSGKTHLLLHLADRALEAGHPVFRLNLERLNFDLGNPQRHLRRLLDESELPIARRPSALERMQAWLRSNAKWRSLTTEIATIAATDTDAARSARRLLHTIEQAGEPRRAAAAFLGGSDLLNKPGSPTYRREAYSRFLLWLELLSRIEGCRGPVLLIDEAENLHTTGIARNTRRTAMRSLAFYCGGALPSACVVIATTPHALVELKQEARELLSEVAEQRSSLEWEDAEMLRRRLWNLKTQPVPSFTRRHRNQLADQVAKTHQLVRGVKLEIDLNTIVRETLQEPPRALVRRIVDELESSWWLRHTTAQPRS